MTTPPALVLRPLEAANTEPIAARAPVAGISVGLSADYGPAQRLYVLRGYVPDGRGITYDNLPIRPGETTRADDSLVLHLTKNVGGVSTRPRSS